MHVSKKLRSIIINRAYEYTFSLLPACVTMCEYGGHLCEINCVCVCTCVYVCTYVCIHVCVSYARTMIFVRVAISVFFFSSPFFAPFHEIFAIESKKQFRYDLPSAGQEIEEAGYSCKTDGIAMGSRMVGVFFLLTALTRFFFFFFFFSSFFFSAPLFSLRFL